VVGPVFVAVAVAVLVAVLVGVAVSVVVGVLVGPQPVISGIATGGQKPAS